MAIGYLNVAIIGRSDGRSAVAAAAYASRTDLIDERTGTAYRYARKSGDLVTSFVWLPKGAPERLRDRATLWNEVEKAENRKNSQTARRIILALPHELTAKQQQQLLQDFIRENFTRKGLAVDASIHEPDPAGDDRNDHAHLLIPTRFIDKDGLGKKDRVSNDRATGLEAWQESWTKLTNRQLERYGHAARISFEVAEGQTPQIHMGPEATALERQGVETRAGDDRLAIMTDNMQPPANDNVQARAVGKEFNQAAGEGLTQPITLPARATPGEQGQAANDNAAPAPVAEPQPIDRDRQDAAWQDAVDSAGIAYEEGLRRLLDAQAAERATFERHGADMTARQAAKWGETVHRHADEGKSLAATSYQPGTMADAEQAAATGVSFLLSLFTSWVESVTRSVTGAKAPARSKPGQDKGKKREDDRRQQQQRDQHQQESAALMAEQSHERESYERRRAAMLQEQQRARDHFERQYAEPSALQQAFDIHTGYVESYRVELERLAARKDARQERERGADRDGPDLTP